MLNADVPVEQLHRDLLRAALRETSGAMTSAEAVNVLASGIVEWPDREDMLAETVLAEDVDDPVRAAALRALSAAAPERAVAAARGLGWRGERLTLAVITALGRLGEPEDMALLERIGSGPGGARLIGVRAKLAQTLLTHRFGLEADAETESLELLPEPGPGASAFASSPAGALRAATVGPAVSGVFPDLAKAPYVLVDIACSGRVLTLVVRRDVLDADGRRRLLGAAAVLGVVTTAAGQGDAVSVELLALSSPTTEGTVDHAHSDDRRTRLRRSCGVRFRCRTRHRTVRRPSARSLRLPHPRHPHRSGDRGARPHRTRRSRSPSHPGATARG